MTSHTRDTWHFTYWNFRDIEADNSNDPRGDAILARYRASHDWPVLIERDDLIVFAAKGYPAFAVFTKNKEV